MKNGAPPFKGALRLHGCHARHACVLKKFIYWPLASDKNYRETLTDARQGHNELAKVDAMLFNDLKNVQSIHHICTHNLDCFTCSERTLYRRANQGCFTAIRANLPSACSMRPRGGKPIAHQVGPKYRKGGRFSDYLRTVAENPDLPGTMIDSLIGTVGGKALFVSSDMLLAILRESNTAQYGSVRWVVWKAGGVTRLLPSYSLIEPSDSSRAAEPGHPGLCCGRRRSAPYPESPGLRSVSRIAGRGAGDRTVSAGHPWTPAFAAPERAKGTKKEPDLAVRLKSSGNVLLSHGQLPQYPRR